MKNKYDINWMDNVDSTNDEVRRHISDLDNLSVLSVLSQSAGRGQRGNSWHSEAGKNLLFSVLLKEPGIQAYDQFVISQMASLSLVDLLASHDIQAEIKWPNDIYVGEKKICGMLIENTVKGKWITSSIIGIGLNVNQINFDVNLPNPISMTACSGQEYDLEDTLEEFMEIFTGYFERFCHITGGYNRLNKLYHSNLWRLDEEAEFLDMTHSPARRFRGIIRGTDSFGYLIVKKQDGDTSTFAFKEISYIL